MAGRRYITDLNTPFFSVDEDDVDDETFLRHSKSGSSGYVLPNTSYCQEKSALEDKRLQLLERKKEIEDRTVQSSERSISLLRDSEQIGVATAEELIRQREQLERTEKRLDDINNALRFSQKHIQGIKSVFGSLKNYLSGKSGEQVPGPSLKQPDDSSSSFGTTATSSPLASTVNSSKANLGSTNENHPGLKIRGLSGDHDTWSQPDTSSGNNVNKVIDRNLEDMCSSLSRLKGLAQGLGEEIDTQNEVLDRLNDKTDKADFTILRQNKEMNKLLKK
ncbi:synaptosomal-associated protein 29 [Zootermopsis nevadensis]|uniref:Synaptosomal-associated protein 29 n=1 Tax=Zootermopsis nevadensis TaxID=136037 RepID=A0A067QZZ5_ZOONE|nr:synaptosomal-associated protein 29 [Zootermopsis nevadensis]KDR12010.1 Synaptosomal-associated protein 29 [Zootermopsis nevadensis]